MSFLAPLFLLGGLAVGLPIVFHLVRRTTRERTLFSSLMFLRPTPPRLTRRNRLEHLLLLLLRCAVLCLLAAGFARPFFKQTLTLPASAEAPRRLALLLDTSASMRRATLWTEARAKLEGWLRKAAPADQVAVFTFDREVTPVVTFDQWGATAAGDRVALVRGRLEDVTPGWAGTGLDQALIRAAEAVTEADEGRAAVGQRQVVVISDFQTGSRLGALQGYEWPKDVGVTVEALTPRATSNASLQLAPEIADAKPTADATVRVRVANEPDAKREQFQLHWARAGGAALPRADKDAPPNTGRDALPRSGRDALPRVPAERQLGPTGVLTNAAGVYVPANQTGGALPGAGSDALPNTGRDALPRNGRDALPRVLAERPLGAAGMLTHAVEVYVPAGQSRIVSLPAPAPDSGADRIVLRGDDEDFDNTVFVVPPQPARLGVVYFGGEPAADASQPRYFLERAFQETRRQTVRVVAVAPDAPLPPQAGAATLLVATGALTPEESAAVRQRLEAGGTLLFAPTNATAAATLAAVLGTGPITVEEGAFANYGMLAEVDFRHPLFAAFADARFSDFTKIHFWKYRRFATSALPDARVLARFDNGDPALAEVPVGRGRVIVLASGWQPADSQLALSSKFVPLLYSLLDLSGAAPPAPAAYQVGDRVPLIRPDGPPAAPVAVFGPDGAPVKADGGATNFTVALVPGVYRVEAGSAVRRFAVNLDPAESRTAPLPADELERLGAPVASAPADPVRVAEQRLRLANAELENRQKLWRWLIVAALGAVFVETWLAGRTARQAAVPEGATS